MDKRETATILALLSSAYPYAKVTKETAVMFHEVWKDLGFVECQKAVMAIVRTSEMFPSAAKVLKEVLDQRGVLSMSSADAWGLVQAQVSQVGMYGRPNFAEGALTEAVTAIGWREICHSNNQGVLRAHFMKMYDSMAQRHDRQVLLSSALTRGNATLSIEAGEAIEADGFQAEE